MKLVTVNVQLPKPVDDHYRSEAKRRFTSKSFLIREVLAKHVERIRKGHNEPEPSLG